MATKIDKDDSRTPPADQDWFGGRRWTGIAAIGFLVLVAVCALVVVIGRYGRSSGPVAAPPAAQATTPADAVIQIVTRTSSGNFQVGATDMTWDGDWKCVMAPSGGLANNIQVIPSLAGFVEWRGV